MTSVKYFLGLGQPYKTVMTLMELKSSYNDSTSTTAVLDIWIRNELDSQHYDIDVVSTNLFVEFLIVDILFLDPVFMTNNFKA